MSIEAMRQAREREAFEAWAIETKQAYRDDHGHGLCFYNAPVASIAWAGWQARAALAAPAEPAALTDERIIAIRDDHLPNQGERFDCIAFARAVLAEQQRHAAAPPAVPQTDAPPAEPEARSFGWQEGTWTPLGDAKDAARWRYARKKLAWSDWFDGAVRWVLFLQMSKPNISPGALNDDSVALELDASIDAAMSTEQPK